MTKETMIEKVARAIAGHYGVLFDDCPKDRIEMREWRRIGKMDDNDGNSQEDHLNAARAAIEAMREPTNDMLDAGFQFNDVGNTYKAMINKALEQ